MGSTNGQWKLIEHGCYGGREEREWENKARGWWSGEEAFKYSK